MTENETYDPNDWTRGTVPAIHNPTPAQSRAWFARARALLAARKAAGYPEPQPRGAPREQN